MEQPSLQLDPATLREKLEWLMLFRLVLVTFLLGSAVVVNVNDLESFSAPSYVAIVSLIVGTYVATLAYAFSLHRGWGLLPLSFGQLAGDGLLAAGLILVTGGIHSIFTFLFFLTIFSGAVLLGRAGAMFAASVSSLGLAGIVFVQFGDFEFVWELLPETIPRHEAVPIYAMIIHLVAFFTVGALSGYLAEKLGQVGSELERRQMDIRALRALNENIVRSLSSGLMTLDLEGRTIFFNAAAERITGFTAAELDLRPIARTIPELGPVVEAAPAIADLTTRPRFELRMIRRDGKEVFLGISVSPLEAADGTRSGYILIFQDVTELKTMREAVLRQEHLSAIGKLSAAIAHEIRNPLAAISGSIEMLRMSLDPPDEERQLMDIVIREVDRLNALIQEFLIYARPAQARRRDVSISELVNDTVRVFRQDPALRGEVTIVIDPSLGRIGAASRVYVDPGQIQQVIWNLLRNACDAMPGGGTIRVAQSEHFDLRTGRNYVTLIFEDSGAGLRDGVIENLFEPFFTTKDGGTGLGLATCHRIVTAHRGQLVAENIEGGGARFTVVLPLDAEFERDEDTGRSASASIDAFSDLLDPSEVSQPSRPVRSSDKESW